MGANYNIHGTDNDNYYYCPSDDCPCNGSSTHRDNYWRTHSYGYDPTIDYDNRTNPFHGCSNNNCSCHYDATTNDTTCDCPCHHTTATDDDYQHYDHIFGSYNDGDDFHPAYRAAYNNHLATKRQPTTA